MSKPPLSSIAVDGELTIYRAAELKMQWLAALPPAGALELNLAGVTEIDTVGVQLLILLKQYALATGGELRLVAHSPAVLEIFELLDLAAWFGDPLVMSA